MTQRLAALWILAAVAACGTSGGVGKGKTDHRSPEDQKRYDEAVARGEVKLGMTRDEVRRAWGKPRRKVRENHRGRKNVEIWLYPFSQVYFDRDGYVFDFRSAG